MATNYHGIRSVFLFLSLGMVLATLFPEIALLPIQDSVLHMRAPETAPRIARWIFGAGAVVFGVVFVTWHRARSAALRVIAIVIELPARSFWVLVLVCAVVPRLIVALAISYEPTSDAWWLHEAAASLARGDGFVVDGKLTAYRPPGYPFLLSLTYRLFGPDFDLAWVWGVVATLIIVLTINFIADRLYGAAVARLATLFAATYPALILMTGQTLSDLPFLAGLLLLIAFALAATPYRLRDSIIIGVAVAMLTLTRGVAIGLFAVIPLIWLLRQRDIRRFAASVVVIAFVFAACITPWMLRNQNALGTLVIGTNLGSNAYVGNHYGAPGGAVADIPPRLSERAQSNEAVMDREMLDQAIEFVVMHPGDAVALLPRKVMYLYLLETEAATSLFQGEHPSPAWLKYALYGVSQFVYIFFLILLCVRVLDLSTPRCRPRGPQWSGWLLTGYFTLLCLILHGQDRYRLPILPWILIESAVVLARATAGARSSALAQPALIAALPGSTQPKKSTKIDSCNV